MRRDIIVQFLVWLCVNLDSELCLVLFWVVVRLSVLQSLPIRDLVFFVVRYQTSQSGFCEQFFAVIYVNQTSDKRERDT